MQYKLKISEFRDGVFMDLMITTDRVLLIGRKKDADICIDDNFISERHALLTLKCDKADNP